MAVNIFEKIKTCQTMRELDELRIDVVHAMEAGESDFYEIQRAFIKKKNSLRRNGHTRRNEGYSWADVCNSKKDKGVIE